MIVRNLREEMMNLMCANRMNDRVNVTIIAIDCRQLPFDMAPLIIDIPWDISKIRPHTIEREMLEESAIDFLHLSVMQKGDNGEVSRKDEYWNEMMENQTGETHTACIDEHQV